MAEKKPFTFDSFDEKDEVADMLETTTIATQAVDVNELLREEAGATTAEFRDLSHLEITTIGRLLRVLPIPTLLIDRSGRVIFANKSCAGLTADYKAIRGTPFAALFADTAVAAKAQSVLEKVFTSGKPTVAEGELRGDAGTMWGRMQLRLFRLGKHLTTLLLIEHLAPSKKQLVLIKKHKDQLGSALDELEARVEQHSAALERTTAHLEQQMEERKRVEDALKASEQTLSSVLSASPTGIGYVEDGRLQWANSALLDMLGEWKERSWLDRDAAGLFATEDEYDRVRPLLEGSTPSDAPSETEARFRRTDGSEFEARLRIMPIDPSKPQKGQVVAITDLSASKQAERELRSLQLYLEKLLADKPAAAVRAGSLAVESAPDSETDTAAGDEVRAAFEHSLNAILVVDATTGTIVRANAALERILKYDKDAVVGKDIALFRLPDRECPTALWLQSIDDAGLVLEDCTLRAADGSSIPVDLTAKPASWNGRTVVVVNFREAHERKQDEDRFRETEIHCRKLLDNVPLGIFSCDPTGNIIESNPEALKVLGVSSPAAARQINVLSFAPLVESGVSSVIDKCLKSGEPVVTEFPNNMGSGKQTYSRLHVTPIKNHDGSVVGAQACIDDISLQKRAETLLLQSERLKAVGEMAGAVAHHFNNLLQFVAGTSRQTLGYLETKNFTKIRPPLEQIFDNTRQAVQTVRRLQQFSRARKAVGVSRYSHAHAEVFDLSDLVREAVEKSKVGRQTDTRKGGQIRLELDLAGGCYVEGEETELVEVVVNLLKNSEESLPVGGTIRVKTYVKNDRVVLLVRDNGVGISEKYLGRIFEPFWTSKEGHVGMGLTTNFGIVRRHRGTLTVTSRKRIGTAFTVQLPLVSKPALKRKPVVVKEATEQTWRILLIDDDEPIVRIFEKGLKILGHTPVPAYSGNQGLKLFEESEFDAVVCDLAMPGMNGWEVARAIHEMCLERGVPKPPFMLLTGWAGQLAEDEILAHPDVDRIVEKPVKVPRLLEILSNEIKGASTDAAFSGRVDGIDLLEYMQLVMLTGKPVVVEVLLRNGLRGLVFVDKGRFLHATCGGLEGEDAIYSCLSFSGGSFSNLPWRDPERVSINKPGEFILIEAARRRDEMRTSTKDQGDGG
ncbi:MAG: PAS domain S-box protein [Desulfomonile tiedjei]|nr:PAS domain S-box protein [Desulfomonile tiedjei]